MRAINILIVSFIRAVSRDRSASRPRDIYTSRLRVRVNSLLFFSTRFFLAMIVSYPEVPGETEVGRGVTSKRCILNRRKLVRGSWHLTHTSVNIALFC